MTEISNGSAAKFWNPSNHKAADKYQLGKIAGVAIETIEQYCDHRGWLIELFRRDDLALHQTPEMAYVSKTLPGVTRGPHEHYEQTDCFAFVGPGDFRVYLWDGRKDSPTFRNRQVLTAGESNHTRIVVPPGVVHAYKNISDRSGVVFNAPNQLFKGTGKTEPIDEIRYEQRGSHPFVMD